MSVSSFGQSQTQLNVQADAAYRKADQELNRTYQQILKEYRTQTVFLQSLKTTQQRWLQFRDAEMKARYPAANSQLEYGSFFPVCYSNGLEELTKARTKQLRLWLTGIPEGDMCNGSVKVAGGKRVSLSRWQQAIIANLAIRGSRFNWDSRTLPFSPNLLTSAATY